MIALARDADLVEGNIFEKLLEGWKHDVRNLWWSSTTTARASTRWFPIASS
jgi:pyruvate dehydrogenase complex dehydrogenase (E1) component